MKADSIASLFENLSEHVWNRIRDSWEYDIRQGEETITDHLLLEIVKREFKSILIFPTSKKLEKKKGTDWEWWIGSKRHGWIRYAVQAKKISHKGNRYDSLNHSVNSSKIGPKMKQFDVLKRFSKANNAIPLYSFYNYVPNEKLNKYWNCSLAFDQKQLGWTFTPLSVIEKILKGKTRGNRNFQYIHCQKQSLPIRCLVKCPNILKKYDLDPTKMVAEAQALYNSRVIRENEGFYRNLPDNLNIDSLTNNDLNEISEFPEDFYNPEIALYPKKIAVIDISDFLE